MSDEIKRYQWIKGDDQGTVEEYVETDGKFLVFQSGRRCNTSLLPEFMVEINDPSEILAFEDPKVEVLQKQAKARKSNKTPEPVKVTKTPEENPILSVLKKSKTTNTKLNIRVQLELPTKDLLTVLQTSFDDDVIDILSGHIVSNIDNTNEYLQEKIKDSIQDWFNKG